MNARPLALLAALLVTGLASSVASAETKWEVKADYIDSCSCNPACPCMFGSPPSKGHCQGATLLDIEKGEYKGVKLDGIKILTVYHGGRWFKIYVDDKATKEQTEAAAKLLPDLSAFFATGKILEVKNVKIEVEETDAKIKITIPGTHVEITPLKNTAGKTIKLQGMPAHGFDGPPFIDFTQYTSVKLSHKAQDKEQKFKYSGSNGFKAKIDAKE